MDQTPINIAMFGHAYHPLAPYLPVEYVQAVVQANNEHCDKVHTYIDMRIYILAFVHTTHNGCDTYFTN